MKGPAAAVAEVMPAAAAAAVVVQKLQLQLTQLAAGPAAVAWVVVVGQWAAGSVTAARRCVSRTGSSGWPEGSARVDCTWQP